MLHDSSGIFILLVFRVLVSQNPEAKTLLYTPNEICLQNPPHPSAVEMSAAFDTCKFDYKKGVTKGHPDRNKKTGNILSTYGYPYKVYKITTKDDYILTVYRIRGSPKLPHEQYKKRKQAAYLMHGLTLAGDCWFFQPGSRNLAFKLADAGYEVWIGNARGTTYSMEHQTLDSKKDLEYWNFSWHEMGMYDIPATTNKILQETGNKKIFFIGHSMGCTQYLVSAAEVPSMNKKIHAAFMMAPQAYMGHMNNGGRRLMLLVDKHEKFKIFNMMFGGRLQSSYDFRRLGLNTGETCEATAAACGACDSVVFSLFGYNAPHMNNSVLSNVFSRVPNTFPLKAMAHYAQITFSCSFRQYDYGEIENVRRYQQLTPPDYNLHKIKTPMYFFHAERDNFAPANDVNITISKLSPGVLKGQYYITDDFFNHVDFALAHDADVMVYNRILEKMKLYQ